METVLIPTEHRRFPRVPLSKPVSVLCAGRTITGIGLNVSGNGILLSIELEHTWVGRALERGLVPGAPLRVFLAMPGNGSETHPVNVVGKIVRVNRDPQSDQIEVALTFQ